jgi:DNA modification methylase
MISFLQGDARHLPLRDRSVQCCVCSPPYWGLRDYGTARWEGGDPACDHRHPAEQRQLPHGDGRENDSYADNRVLKAGVGAMFREECGKCGARRIDAQIGLEATPDAYVQTMVAVFREVRRVLKDDGTLWLVLGDSYCSSPRGNKEGDFSTSSLTNPQRQDRLPRPQGASSARIGRSNVTSQLSVERRIEGLKPKDLCMIPARVALALQADGWWLRADIIWAKAREFDPEGVGSTMPENVRDRPTKAHEFVFLLTKRSKYYYDHKAVEQPGVFPAGTRAAKGSGTREGNRRGKQAQGSRTYAGFNDRYFSPPDDGYAVYSGKRRLRDVWRINPKPYTEAHFATYPEALVIPCLLAGSRPGDLVLDPFSGAGTTALACYHLHRSCVGIDLKPDYLRMAERRLRKAGWTPEAAAYPEIDWP